jgi:rhamnose utilization protein RhaD (predicted bifunctional aldolase and dehydrogenase)/NAD(P)-dependent dehydrogenase (short-subunit alcohol dehydrogenase family)
VINRWDEKKAIQYVAENPVLGSRVYSSRLLGEESKLVLHGGGNTSLKGATVNIFGEEVATLFVKGSGSDLKTIESEGFPPVDRERLLRLAELPVLTDSEMMRELRLALLEPTAPTPSVEAIMHALIPLDYVDHTHSDAVVTLSNTRTGETRLRELYGDEVLILPYVMPGFVLAKQIARVVLENDCSHLRGIVLLHHGIITFANSARESYDEMISLVTMAEEALLQGISSIPDESSEMSLPAEVLSEDILNVARIRKSAGEKFEAPILVALQHNEDVLALASETNVADLIQKGPLTPDHTIHTKPFGACFDFSDGFTDFGFESFETFYCNYFSSNASVEHQRLDLVPRFAAYKGRAGLKALVTLAPTVSQLGIVSDIVEHTAKAILNGELLGGWCPLSHSDLFDVEYWELEQAKVKKDEDVKSTGEFTGRVALVTGAASGIGLACVNLLVSKGAAVLAVDKSEDINNVFKSPSVLAYQGDLTEPSAITGCVEAAVKAFGGIDILVSNAGNFLKSANIELLEDSIWESSLDINLTSHMKLLRECVPFLRLGFDAAVIFVGSKNVAAPGPGAVAYSASKAGLSQLARVAALELGEDAIRVNTIHPNAVYDTGLWDTKLLKSRAEHYRMSIDAYRRSNVLKTDIASSDVATAILAFAGQDFLKTTGAQVPVDGGNQRVI